MLRKLAQTVTMITRVIVENTSKIAADTATGARNNIENGQQTEICQSNETTINGNFASFVLNRE